MVKKEHFLKEIPSFGAEGCFAQRPSASLPSHGPFPGNHHFKCDFSPLAPLEKDLFLLFYLLFLPFFFFSLFLLGFGVFFSSFSLVFFSFSLVFTPSPNSRRATRTNPPNYKIQSFIQPILSPGYKVDMSFPKPARAICYYFALTVLPALLRAPTSPPSASTPSPARCPLRSAHPPVRLYYPYHKSSHF